MRTVMITGAAGNLGVAIAAAFARLGDNRVLVDVAQDRLDRAFATRDASAMLAATNLLDPDAVRGTVARAVERFGGIDVLCNLAGGFRMGDPVHATSDADWSFLFDVNVRTLLYAMRAVVPVMLEQGRGRIVNVGAFAATRGSAQMGAYAAAKSAVIRLTESSAAELRDNGINVNCVLPTIIDTPQNRADMPAMDPARWVAPDDLARVIVFLASDDARAIHGAAVPVSGLS
jgi:NAD(P)-dependent dehydrogenase (short-subunit alcohol dehydrogenase family)